MISRFFASPLFRRLLCCLLALATVCLCLAPALVQPAFALAGVDDAALAVGLLFCTWAGVTFATNQGAYNAVSNFLNSSVNGLKACTEVAAKNLVNGTLTLTKGVRDAFNSILPEINSTYKPIPGSSDGALVGSTPAGVPIGIPSFADSSSASNLNYYSADLFAKGAYPISVSTSKGVFQLAPYFKESYEAKFGVYVVDPSGKTSLDSGHIFMYSTKFVDFTSYFVGNKLYFASHHIYNGKTYLTTICAYTFTDVKSSSMSFPASEDAIPFNRNQTINGSQAADALSGTDFGDGRDRNIDIAALLAAIAAGLAGSAAAPGLSPADLIEILKKALYIPGSGAEVLPTEVPDVTEDTQPDPSKDPDDDKPSVNPLPPDQFNFFGDAFEKVNTGLERIGDRLQQLQDGILPQIELFKDAVTQGFIDVGNWFSALGNSLLDGLKSLGENLAAGFKSLYDTLHEFATQTFPSKMAEVGQWIQSLPEKIAEAIQKILPEPEVPPGFDDMMLPGLKDFFPFCIPFDMYDMMAALCADPEAPKFTFATSFLGHIYSVEIDLAAWNTVAVTVRYMVVAIYIVALAIATRKFIKW